ncbi:MAG: hypothetical protein ACXVQ5_00160 [Actinomycetota bacterium]
MTYRFLASRINLPENARSVKGRNPICAVLTSHAAPAGHARPSLRLIAATSVLLLTVFGLGALNLPPAHASYPCTTTEENLFVQPYFFQAMAQSSAIYVRQRPIDVYCGASQAFSTAHVENSTNDNFVEVGWEEFPLPGANIGWVAFWETQVGTVIDGTGRYIGVGDYLPCCQWSGFKVVVAASGSTYWKMYYAINWNQTYIQVGPSGGKNVLFGTGIPTGETGRYPNNDGTGAFDHQTQLYYATSGCGCSYTAWQNNFPSPYIPGSISTYHWVSYGPNQYQVEHN